MKFNFALSYISALSMIILYLIYFRKKKSSNVRTKLYILFIIFSELFIVSDITNCFIHQYSYNTLLQRISWTSHWVLCIVVFYIFYLYVISTIYKIESNKISTVIKSSKKTIIMTIFGIVELLVFIFIIPYDPFDINNINFIPGLSAIVNGGATIVYGIMYGLETIISRNKMTKEERVGVYFQLVVFLATLILQFTFKDTSFIPFAVMLTSFFIFSNSENPDFIDITNENAEYEKLKILNDSKSYLVDSVRKKLDEHIKRIKLLNRKLLKEDISEEEKKKIILELEVPSKEIINLLDTRVSISNLITHEDLNVEKYRVRTFIDKIVANAENKLKSKDVEFIYDIDPNIPFVLSGDVNKISAVINSLIENAIYFTTYGKILLHMSYNKINDNNVELIISVTDTGEGMTKEYIDKINTSLNSITFLKKITENLSGTLIYESTIGAGSTFYMKVPQAVEDSTPMGGYTKFIDYTKKNIEYNDYSSKRILIVDDNSVSIKVLTKQLKKYNIVPDTCINSVGCIQKVKSGNEYDLIFMDDYMEGTTGKDTLELISKISKISGYKLAPVVVFTANAIAGAKQSYIARGFDDYLEKPIDIVELDKILKGKFEK